MKLETFFNKFDELADAPDAVPRMRRFILDLAVQGKLVAQDAKDEPADELLKRVQAEKARLVKSGEIKKQEQLPPVGEDAIPFSLPAGWAASQLGDVTVCLDYMREPINGTERDLRIAGKTQAELFPYYGATQQQGWIDDFIFDAELVLLGEDGVPFFDALRSKAYLISGKTWVNNHAHVFRGLLVSNPYLMHWLNVFDYTGRVAGSTRSKLNQAKAVDIPIALPPLAEQKRIVAKVDELMALCDRLEAQQQERETRHAALARASLARFADAPTPANLPFLFHPSYAIPSADLRKSILTLAVQGKLVPQDPNDEPAAPHHKRQRAERNAEGIPDSWALSSLDEVAEEIVDCPHSTPKWTSSGKICVRTNQFRPGRLDLSETKFVSEDTFEDRIQRLRPREDDILYSREGGILGIACRVPPKVELCLGQRMMLIRAGRSLAPTYLELVLNAPLITEIARRQTTGGAAPRVNVSTVKSYPIPIPPLAEQRRIVAKVEQLMALVDALETQLAASRATAANLLSALVAELTRG